MKRIFEWFSASRKPDIGPFFVIGEKPSRLIQVAKVLFVVFLAASVGTHSPGA